MRDGFMGISCHRIYRIDVHNEYDAERMKMKWYIFIVIALVILTMANQKTMKKEAKYTFRCSEDNSAVEMFNKNTASFTTWQQCDNGECIIGFSGPTCIIT